MRYNTLNDAADAHGLLDLDPGSTEIWYQRKEYFGEIRWGTVGIDPNELSQTHILLGKVCESDLNRLYSGLQGENWSPNGEARSLITRLGLGHTSMSVGDIIVNHEGTHIVEGVGFKRLDNKATV